MDYLDYWRKGFKEGKDFSLEQINEHCKANFQNMIEVIMFIMEVQKSKEVENDKS